MESTLKYWLGFSRAAGIGAVRLHRLIDRFGGVAAAWLADEAALEEAGLGAAARRGLLEARQLDLDAELEAVRSAGIRPLTWDDPEYPPQLLEIASPPVVLFCRGTLDRLDRTAVAIVGTRRPTPYGQAVAHDLATALAVHGVTVVSGLARGIDSIAHRASLEAGGRTLAVLGSGLDRIYPPEHRSLAETIAGKGALLTEFGLGTAPEPQNFPARNRIVAGLARAVIVVEAGESSGALITADLAADQGRDVFAVPGSIYSRASLGANRLIGSGATPLTSAGDVLEALQVTAPEPLADAPPSLGDDLEGQLAGMLSDEPKHADEFVAGTRRSASEVLAALAMLELQGRAVAVGGMQYVRGRRPVGVAWPC